MFSKADSFPIKSIRTSGNKVMGNLSKNTQTYILGKKVKTNSETKFQTHKMRYTILKANFQCRHTTDQVTDCESRKYCFSIKKQYPGFFNILAKVDGMELYQQVLRVHYFPSWNRLSRRQVIWRFYIKRKLSSLGRGKTGLAPTESPWTRRLVKQSIYSEEMLINQLSSKGGSHLMFRAVNWWNESPNSHDSLTGPFLSMQPLVTMEPEPSLRESRPAEGGGQASRSCPQTGWEERAARVWGRSHMPQWPAYSGRLPWEYRECAGRDLWSREQCSETWPASSPSELLYPSPLSLVQSPPQRFSRASSFWLNPQPQSSWIWKVLAPTFPLTHPSSLRSAQDTTLFSVAPQFPANSQLPRQCIWPFAVWSCSLPASPQTFLAPVLCSHTSYSGMLSLSFMPLHKLISVPRMPLYFSIHIKFP